MSLKLLRMIQRLIGILLIIFGVYLIFGAQEFFGTLLIILAFLIFPNLENRNNHTQTSKVESHNHNNDAHPDAVQETDSLGDSSDEEGNH